MDRGRKKQGEAFRARGRGPPVPAQVQSARLLGQVGTGREHTALSGRASTRPRPVASQPRLDRVESGRFAEGVATAAAAGRLEGTA